MSEQNTPAIEAFQKSAPELMSELMQAYIEKKDLNDRAKIKRKMSAVLAFVATDTTYPNLPAPQIQSEMALADYAAFPNPQRRGGGAQFLQQMNNDGELDETLGVAAVPNI